MKRGLLLVVAAVVAAACTHPHAKPAPAGLPPGEPGPPVARVAVVEETLFGVKVADPYRWMEQPDNAELTAWMKAQGEYAAKRLAAPAGRAPLLARLRELAAGASTAGWAIRTGDSLVYERLDAGSDLPKVVVRAAGGAERVLVDPATLAASGGGGGDAGGGGHASIDNYSVSPDGRLLAYNVAGGGSEITTIQVLDIATGKVLDDRIEHIWGQFDAEWLPDGSGFLYTQMDAKALADPAADSVQNMKMYVHRLGTAADKDTLFFGRGVHDDIEIAPQEFPLSLTARGSTWLAAIVTGARSELRVYVAPVADVTAGKARWRKVSAYEDSVEQVCILGDQLYLLSSKGASNKRVLRVPAAKPDLAKAAVVVPEDPEVVVTGIYAAKEGVYVHVMQSGRSRLRLLDAKTLALSEVPLPADGAIQGVTTDPREPGVTIMMVTWLSPVMFWTWDAKAGRFVETGIAGQTAAKTDGLTAEEIEVAAPDGAMVPLTILRRKDLALDGSHPAILDGYGAYGTSITPGFSSGTTAWLDRGGVYAYAHVRGGGEKGHQWYLDGKGAKKLVGVGDFNTCAEYLIQHGYTAASHLSALGASAGGILVGRAITERPDLYAAAAISAGIVNSLRILHAQNGANQVAELGSPDDEEGFEALLAMDVVHSVKDGTAYPAVLLLVGLNDKRVSPWMSAKLTARLQAATSSHRPILLRLDPDAGHGFGSTRDQYLVEDADTWSFFLQQSGDPAFQ